MLRHACAAPAPPPGPAATVRAHPVAFRPSGRPDAWGDPGRDVLLCGIGWRPYSTRTGRAWVDGEWRVVA